MRILNRKEFMKIKGQVLYAKYKPAYFTELEIKVDNCGGNDFTFLWSTCGTNLRVSGR